MISAIRSTRRLVAREQQLWFHGLQRSAIPLVSATQAVPGVVFNDSISNNTDLKFNTNIIREFSTYREKKLAAKELRRKVYAERQAHKEKVKTRRKNKSVGSRKEAFQAWFKSIKLADDVNDHWAKKSGMTWNIRVAVVLERLPIVLPDKPKWEEDYDNLKTYLNQFERTYPDDLFGKLVIDEPEDLTDEAFLGKQV